MTNLRIAAQRAGAAARHIGKNEIEGRVFSEFCCVCQTELDAAGVCGEALTHLFEARRARFAGENMGLGIALRHNQGLSSRRRAGVEDFSVAGVEIHGCNLRDQLRAFVLHADAALLKCQGSSRVAGNHDASKGEQLAGLEHNAGLRKLGFCLRDDQAKVVHRLGLAVGADCAGRVKAVKANPALNHPGRVGFDECKFGGRLRDSSLSG